MFCLRKAYADSASYCWPASSVVGSRTGLVVSGRPVAGSPLAATGLLSAQHSAELLLREMFVTTGGTLIIGERLREVTPPVLPHLIEAYLSQVDTSLRFVTAQSTMRREPLILSDLFSDLELVPEGNVSPISALDYLRDTRTVVVLGAPGSGKTTLLRYLARQFARARLDASQALPLPPKLAWPGPLALPLYLSLTDLPSNELLPITDEEFFQLLCLQVVRPADTELSTVSHYLDALLKQGDLLLLLDGLDAIGDTSRRSILVSTITAFQRRFPLTRIIVTCRIAAYQDQTRLIHPFQYAVLQDLRPDQQDMLLRRLLIATGKPGQPFEEATLDLFTQVPELRALVSSPLLLTVVGLQLSRQSQIPLGRGLLYEELLKVQFAQLAETTSRLGLGAEQWLRCLQELAYQLQAGGREAATQEELHRWIEAQLPTDVRDQQR